MDRTLDGVVILRSRSSGCERGRAEPAQATKAATANRTRVTAIIGGSFAADVSDGRPKHELGQSERGEANHAGEKFRTAGRITGAISAIRDSLYPQYAIPLVMMIDPPARDDEMVVAARQAIGDDEYAVAWSEGLSITLEQAAAEILTEDSREIQR